MSFFLLNHGRGKVIGHCTIKNACVCTLGNAIHRGMSMSRLDCVSEQIDTCLNIFMPIRYELYSSGAAHLFGVWKVLLKRKISIPREPL